MEARTSRGKKIKPPQSKSELPEREIQKQLSNLLRLKGVTFCTPVYGRKTRMKTGWPDYTFAIAGQACAWEAKTGSNDPTYEQQLVMTAMIKEGWHVAVIRRVEEGFDFLKAHGL
jgi:hypothetical protein